MGKTDVTMILVALAFPVLLMLLLLSMERVEHPLRVNEMGEDLEGVLDSAQPDEVETFVSDGFAPELNHYWKRRRPGLHTGP